MVKWLCVNSTWFRIEEVIWVVPRLCRRSHRHQIRYQFGDGWGELTAPSMRNLEIGKARMSMSEIQNGLLFKRSRVFTLTSHRLSESELL